MLSTARYLTRIPAGIRSLHGSATKSIPAPRGDIKDPATFLTKIGRNSAQIADKFKSWDHLFTASTAEMKSDMALSVKQRRWILNWREKYRQGVNPYDIPLKPPKKKTK
ncbi:MAG: IGR protein motif-domain-containing protein [Benniella sp.]|nr:MAG: IGR protein motif-domain-containing protein [Benniella sp.]